MITTCCLFGILVALMAIFFSIQRGFNPMIRGLAAIHQRLGKVRARSPAGVPNVQAS